MDIADAPLHLDELFRYPNDWHHVKGPFLSQSKMVTSTRVPDKEKPFHRIVYKE
jgi:hypothetical protein